MRVSTAWLLPLLLAAGCGQGAPPPADARSAAPGCAARPEGSRWAGDYESKAVFGETEDEAITGTWLAGIAVADERVYVAETGRTALWVLRAEDLAPVRQAGREGDGPGEWRPFGAANDGGSQRCVTASAAGVRLFDGQRIQEFTPSGHFDRTFLNAAQQSGISPLQSRLAFIGDTLLYTSGGYDVFNSMLRAGKNVRSVSRDPLVDGRQPWFVRMRVGGDVRDVLQLGLVPLPPKKPVGPAQAQPLWDVRGLCVVASDGAEPLLVHASLGGSGQDTVRVPLPDRADRAADYEEKMKGLPPWDAARGAHLGGPHPGPDRGSGRVCVAAAGAAARRASERAGGDPGATRRGPAVTDTVPGFPRLFGAPGVFYAEERGDNDETLVVRYALAGGS